MDISPFIKELLFRYSCVTVPGLGSFMSEEQGSDINKKQNRLLPPSKAIAFNPLLKGPDTLLGTYISKKKHISYDSSMYFIGKYVSTIHDSLNKSGSFELKGIGQFTQDHNKNLFFSDAGVENFLLQSFGFSGIQAMPISRESGLMRMLKKVTFRTDYNSRARYRKAARLAYLFILVCCCGLTIYSSKDFKGTIQYSDLNPFHSVSTAEEAKPVKILEAAPVVTEEKTVPVTIAKPAAPDTISLQSSAPKAPAKTIVTPAPKALAKPQPEPVEPTSGKFKIIGGVFSEKKNARKYIKELKTKGIDASLLPSNGRIRVSLGQFDDEATARKELEQIKSNIAPDAWLLTN